MEKTVPGLGTGSYAGSHYDTGLRKYLSGVFAYMGGALVLSALVAFAVANIAPVAALVFGTPLKWIAIFAPLALVMFASFRFDRLSLGTLHGLFWGFAGLMGVSLASALLVFTGTSIVQAFLSASIVFLTMALWGYTTERDLSGWGSFLMVGLIGVIGASILNLFLGSGTLSMVVSVIGVIVFTGLTAWDMQRLKGEYLEHRGAHGHTGQRANSSATMGAEMACRAAARASGPWPRTSASSFQSSAMRSTVVVATWLSPAVWSS